MMGLHWSWTVDANTILSLVLIPLCLKIIAVVGGLFKDVAFCKEVAQKAEKFFDSYEEKGDDLEAQHLTVEIRLAKIESALAYILPSAITDDKIAQVYVASLQQPVRKEEVRRKTSN